MAALNPQDNNSLDQSIPKWKRELILRRRALSRTLPAGNTSVKLTCPSVVTAVKQADQATAVEDGTSKYQRRLATPPAASKGSLEEAQADFLLTDRGGISSLAFAESPVVVSNMRLVEQRADAGNDFVNGVSIGSNSVGVTVLKCRERMGEEKLNQSCVSKKTMNSSVVLSENNNSLEDSDSDSSEELQYGPGIVNRLKDKYMSMTLRENQSRVTRTSFNNMRRAASLENLVDSEELDIGKQQNKAQHRYTKRSDASSDSCTKHPLPQHHRYRGINRGNDSMKRARSVETLLRYDNRMGHSVASDLPTFDNVNKPATRDLQKSKQFVKSLCRDDVIIVENKSKSESVVGASEDKQHVSKGPPSPKPRSQSVASETEFLPPDLVKQALKIFERRPHSENAGSNVANKSASSAPKTSANTSTVGNVVGSVSKPALSPKPSPDKIAPTWPSSPKKTIPTAEQVVNSSPQKRNTLEASVSPSRSPTNLTSSLGRLQSPSPTTEIYKLFCMNDTDLEASGVPLLVSNVDSTVNICSGVGDVVETTDGQIRVISPLALENIRKYGMSERYHFIHNNDTGSDKPKSHLPGLQTAVVSKAKPPSPVLLKSEHSPVQKVSPVKPTDSPQTQVKQVGIIKPMVTSKSASNSFLTSREKENNFKNREKSGEQSVIHINKVTDASARSSEMGKIQIENSVSDIFPSRMLRETKGPGLWDKKPASNELTYNFVNSKTSIPDYIPNDGLILRKQPVKPKAGESGYIRLSGSSDESSTDADAEGFDDSPPSPCNVVFVGGNVLINGRSNIRKENKSRKMHISFNDSATTTFEYPSEASLLGEGIAPTGGSSLASYTPSKVVLGTEGFQLGVTRSLSNSTPPVTINQESSEKDETVELDQHLKPAEDGETMAWSEGNTADLLF